MFLRRSIATFTFAVFVLSPLSAAARELSDIVNTSANTVSRASFVSWSFTALGLPKQDTCRLPYTRTPKGLVPTLCAAQDRGALTVFGSSRIYPLNKNITRGEALQVLTALTGKQDAADTSAFTDVKTGAEKKAVANAVANKWMVPVRSDMFGIGTPLTGVEALSLLQAVSGQSPVTQKVTVTITRDVTRRIPKQELMEAVWELIQRDYIKSDKVSEDDVGYKTIEALVKSLDDPYSTFYRPTGASAFQDQFKGEISGIGAHIEDKDGVITIVSPLTGSPAERAGILAGDQVISADGKKLEGMSLEQAVQHIRGEKGTTVELVIRRNGAEMTVRITRDIVSIPEVRVTWQNNIAVVELLQFGETTETKIRGVFETIQKENPRGIVLDLRNNPGGLLNAADIVVSNFVPKGSVVAQVKSKEGTSNEKTQWEPTIDPSVKIAVLVNKGSASASEIVAGALQDYKRATIVGVQTFGKGSVQEVITFKTGELLKLTMANYFTPNGNIVDGVGITPDIIVDGEPRTQMDRALSILR